MDKVYILVKSVKTKGLFCKHPIYTSKTKDCHWRFQISIMKVFFDKKIRVLVSKTEGIDLKIMAIYFAGGQN